MFSFFLRSELVTTNLLQFIKFFSRTQSFFFKDENISSHRAPSDYTMCAASRACISTHRQVVYAGQCNRRRTNPLSHHICRTAPKRAAATTKRRLPASRRKQSPTKSFHSGRNIGLEKKHCGCARRRVTDGMASPTAVCKTGVIKVFPFCIQLYVPAVQAHG